MVTNQAILVACLVAAIVFAVLWLRRRQNEMMHRCKVPVCKKCAGCSGHAGPARAVGGDAIPGGPWAALQRRLDLVRGQKADAFGQPSALDTPEGLAALRRSNATVSIDQIRDSPRGLGREGFSPAQNAVIERQIADMKKYGAEGFTPAEAAKIEQWIANERHQFAQGFTGPYDRSGSAINPEAMSEAERSAWTATTEASGCSRFDAEVAHDATGDAMQYHSTEPPIDYNAYVSDLVLDPRTRDNHAKWVAEMLPFSGTAMMVDNMDEAMEASTNFVGLRRPQAVLQYNPQQLTERDTGTFSGNKKFIFNG